MSKQTSNGPTPPGIPVRGCTKISPGCKHCYAETFAERFRGVKGHPYEQGFDLRLVPEKLTEPFFGATPKLVFVNSMSDLFQDGVPDDYADAVSQVMATANWHTYQVLTKRSERLRDLLERQAAVCGGARKHLVGCQRRRSQVRAAPDRSIFSKLLPGCVSCRSSRCLEDIGVIDLSGISWVIVGGESGPGARPMKKEWVVSIQRQCEAYGVPFFFKQWGGVRKKKNGRELDGRTYDEYPRRVVASVPDRTRCAAFAENFLNSFRGMIRGSSLVQVGA